MTWCYVFLALLVAQTTASHFSREFCGTTARSVGVSGGLCKSFLDSYSGELPKCDSDASALQRMSALEDLFSPAQTASLPADAANLVSRSGVCFLGQRLTTFSSELRFLRPALPGCEGPCCQEVTETYDFDPDSEDVNNFRRRLNYFTSFTDMDAPLRSPECYDIELYGEILASRFSIDNSNWGDRPFCSHFTDPGVWSQCDELARFRQTEEGETHVDSAGNYTYEYCVESAVWVNPLTDLPEIVYCTKWTDCGITEDGAGCNTPGTPPCPSGNESGRRRFTPQIWDAGFQYFNQTDGADIPPCNPDLYDDAGGAGCNTPGMPPCPPSNDSGRDVIANPQSNDYIAELFQLLSEIHFAEALKASDPWQEIMAQMCSCACGVTDEWES